MHSYTCSASEPWNYDSRNLHIPCSVCREQWIRAKYERKEFTADTNNDQPYISGLLLFYHSRVLNYRLCENSLLQTELNRINGRIPL